MLYIFFIPMKDVKYIIVCCQLTQIAKMQHIPCIHNILFQNISHHSTISIRIYTKIVNFYY